MIRITRSLNAALIALVALSSATLADDLFYPARVVSGPIDGNGRSETLATVGILHIPNMNAIRVVFEDWTLGGKTTVVLRSLEDDAVQFLSPENLARWRGGSAIFNGDAVEISLLVGPEDQGVSVSIAGALVEEVIDTGPRTICGPSDNRAASTDPRVARLGTGSPSGCNGGGGCTAWLFSNGAMMTAGHCGPNNNSLVQFNVPLSDADGSLNFPAPEDQYLANGATIVNQNSGNYNDWSTFAVFPNTNTGLMPAFAQNAFYRGTIEAQSPTNIRITGFGYDDSPPGSCNWVSTHKAQQSHAGAYMGYTDNGATERYESYRADTQPANSGSPILMDGTTLAMGVHTNGLCNGANPETGANTGPSFRNTALRDAVINFYGTNVRYADVGHPSSTETGTVFQPFDRVTEAFSSVGNNGTVFIVQGNYTAASGHATLYSGKNVLFRAPVGSVLIGN